MRVIAGEFRSRRLKSVPGLETRPTSDRLRETLFDVLGPRVAGAVFLDAYAGTGAMGIEALSRGAARSIFIETSRHAVEVIRENLHSLGVENRARVLAGKVANAITNNPADIVFLDPPYEKENEYQLALTALGSAEPPAAMVIVQHSIRFDPGDAHGVLRRTRTLKQSDNMLSFYQPLQGEPGSVP